MSDLGCLYAPYVQMPPVCLIAPLYVWMLLLYVWTPLYVWMPPYVWTPLYVWTPPMFGHVWMASSMF